MLIELIKSVALLLALSYLQNLNSQKWDENSLIGKINTGLLFGVIAVVVMMAPIQLQPGLIFDPRSVIVSLVGLFYGGLTTIIAVVIAAVYRAYLGGAGMATGILVIVVCALMGVAFRYYRAQFRISNPYVKLYVFGIVVHLAVLTCFLTLSAEVRWKVIETMAMPFLLILPLATLFLGVLLMDIEKRLSIRKSLEESEKNYRNLFEEAGASIWLEDFSRLISLIEQLKQQDIDDYSEYLKKHPQWVSNALNAIQVIDVNQASLDLYGAKNKHELLKSLEKTFLPESQPVFINELVALLEGKSYFRAEALTQTLQGNPIHILLTIAFPKNLEGWKKVIVSMMDISEQKRIEASLRFSEHRHQEVIETAVDGFWLLSKDGFLKEVNAAYVTMSGYTRQELLTMHIRNLEVQETINDIQQHIETVIQQGSDVFQTKHKRKNGVIWPVEVTVTYSTLDGGCFFVFLRDIYQRQLTEYLTNLKHQLSEIAYKGNVAGIMTEALDTAEAITGSQIGFFHLVEPDQETISLQVWSTNTLKNMCHAKGEGAHYPVSEAGVWVDCIHQRKPIIHNNYAALPHKKGMPPGHAHLDRELTVPVLRQDQIVAVMGVGNKPVDYYPQESDVVQQIADIAYDYIQRKQAEERIEYLAYYDVLTGLPNRTLLLDRINQAIAHSKRIKRSFALCFLDVDGFKPINDRYGHEIGDQLLMEISLRLKDAIREGDSLSRLGGDEFIMVLTQLDNPDDYEIIIKRILSALAEPFVMDAIQVQVTASIGITFYPQDDHDADTLLRHADQAMYKAKASGKNQYYIHDYAFEQQQKDGQEIVSLIKPGIKAGQFELFYQPKVNIRNGEVIGLEALIRWHHPQRGLLAPGLFLSYLENTNEAILLGNWVIQQAIQHLETHLSEGLNISISVNISAQHLQHSHFVGFLKEQLEHASSNIANYLEFEILETASIEDTTVVAALMGQCAELGIKFSLDDFGTGYSSLTYFHRLPIDILKIDQHFVRDILDDPDDWKIVQGVINLAEQYHRPVIAEGVESIEIAAMLMSLGNTFMQGYAISRPIPQREIRSWLMQWQNKGLWKELQQLALSNDSDIAIQVAILSLERWVEQIINAVDSNNPSMLPELSSFQCSFSHWYQGLGKFLYGSNPSYPFIGPKHEKVHQLGKRLIESEQTEQQKQSSLDTLQEAKQELITAIICLQAQTNQSN